MLREGGFCRNHRDENDEATAPLQESLNPGKRETSPCCPHADEQILHWEDLQTPLLPQTQTLWSKCSPGHETMRLIMSASN